MENNIKFEPSPGGPIRPVQSKIVAHTMKGQLYQECLSMIKYALSKGIKVPSRAMGIVGKYEQMQLNGEPEPEEMAPILIQLNHVHTRLSDLIEPIKPGTCHLIIREAEKDSFWNIFGAVPMARKIAAVAFCSLILMLGISLSEDVSSESLGRGILNNNGWILLKNLVFLLSTSSLGSAFALLFRINRELEDGRYEEDDNSSYISTWVMGMAAGMILAEVIPLDLFGGDGSGGLRANEMSKLILALLGGFASFLVYNILNTIVDALGSAFKKDNREEIIQESKRVRTELNQEMAARNMEMANRLVGLRNALKAGSDSGELDEELEKIMQQMLHGEEGVIE